MGIAIGDSGISRDKIFLTTKVLDGWTDVPAALEKSIEKLRVAYADL